MIIGLSGYSRSGKDTVAGILIGLHGYNSRAFANGVRELLLEVNPAISINEYGSRTLKDIVQTNGWEEAKKYKLVREYLQTLGLGARKVLGEETWINHAMSGISSSQQVVFTDVRFPNEAQMIKNLYGQIWRIQRPGVVAVNNHPSESAMDSWKFDKIIMNNTGLDGLKQQIASCLV